MPEIAEDPRDRTSLSDAEFKKQLGEVIPHLRAFGRSLSGNRDVDDDLVQETLLKAWEARERFQAGTDMRAWAFLILRNYYLSQIRRSRFRGDRYDHAADRPLRTPSGHDNISE